MGFVSCHAACSLIPHFSTFVPAEGELQYLNWSDVFAGGGGVLACLQPLPDAHADTPKRKYFHDVGRMWSTACTLLPTREHVARDG